MSAIVGDSLRYLYRAALIFLTYKVVTLNSTPNAWHGAFPHTTDLHFIIKFQKMFTSTRRTKKRYSQRYQRPSARFKPLYIAIVSRKI